MKLGSETCKKKVGALLLVTILWCGDCMRLTLNRRNCYGCVCLSVDTTVELQLK